jgi:membrane fusion protein, multidrug efflux system
MTAPLDPAPAGQKPRKRTVAFLIFLGVVALAGVAGLLYWRFASQFEETDDAFIDGNIVAVSPQIAGRISRVLVHDNQDVKAGDLLAEIDPTDYANAVKQAQAALEMAKARVDVARTSEDLVKVSTAAQITQAKAGVSTAEAAVITAQAAVRQAQAGIDRAQAGIAQAQATVAGAQAQVASAQADVAAAQAEATRRAADVKRYEGVDPRALSQQQLDAARAAAEASAAQLAAAQKRKLSADAQVEQDQSKLVAARAAQSEAEAAVAAASSNVEQAKSRVAQANGVLDTANTAAQQMANAQAQVEAAQAGVDQAHAALDVAQQQLAYTKIVAPVSGRVTRKSVQPGQVVDAGRNLMALVEPDVWVTANFKETQLTRMHAGQAVDIWVDTYPGRVFKGKIDSFQSGTGSRFSLLPAENATGNFVKVVQRVPVKIVFSDNAGAKLLLGPGMSVVPRVRIAGDEGTPAPITRLDAGAN